jgi:hypothetical protein
MISLEDAPINDATCARAVSTTVSDSQPYECVRECGLPYDPIYIIVVVEYKVKKSKYII